MKKTKLISVLAALSMIISNGAAYASAYSTGDANRDGSVNVRDCAYIARTLAEGQGSSLPPEADYNGDGSINVRDAANLAADIAKGAVSENSDFEYEGTLPTDGDKMTVLCWTGSDLDPMLETWMADEGYSDSQVSFLNFQIGGGEAMTKYNQYILSGGDLDMFIAEPDWAQYYLDNPSLSAPVSDLGFTESDFYDQYYYTLALGKSTSGTLKGIAWDAYPGAWCYRTDLAGSYLGVSTPDEMQVLVSDWDEFLNTAEKVYNASEGRTAITSTISGMLEAYTGSRTERWVSDGKLSAESYFRDFIDLAKSMSSSNYVTPVNQWTTDWYDLGSTDSSMGYFVPTWGFGSAILETAAGGENGATYGKWGVCEGPSPYYWGGSLICASPQTDNADMVASFINYFAVNKDTMKAYALEQNKFVNSMTVMQEIIDKKVNKNPLLGGQDENSVLHENAKNINMEGKISSYDSTIKTSLLDAVRDYCNDEITDADACYEAFKSNVSAAIPKLKVD
ncbi:MAG: dockerin type I domain-containing protein [Porcipelethomonas sp.]